MTKEDLKIISDLVNKVRNGTQVRIYDRDGKLCCFALENVIDIVQDQSSPAISYIYISNNSGYYTSLDYRNFSNGINGINGIKIPVFGSVDKWKKLLNFDKANILNCD